MKNNTYESRAMQSFTRKFSDFHAPNDETLFIKYKSHPEVLREKLREYSNQNVDSQRTLSRNDIEMNGFPIWVEVDSYDNYFEVGGLNWPEYIPENKKYGLIFAEFPFNIHRVDYFDINNNLTSKALTYLGKEGLAVFITTTRFANELKVKLPQNGFYVDAILNIPKTFIEQQHTSLEMNIVVISKKSPDKIFYGEIPEFDDELIGNAQCIGLLDNYLENRESGNLVGGMFLPLDYEFLGFKAIYASLEIDKLQSIYKDYKKFSIEQLASSVNLCRQGQFFIENRNAIYIPRLGVSQVVSSISETKLKHHNYYQVVLKSNAINIYVASFFKSKIGKLTLESLKSGFIVSISKKNLLKLSVPIPNLDTQKKIVSIDEQITNVQNNLNLLKDELSVNPLNVSTLNAIDGISTSINELTTGDQLRGFIVSGESKTIEFKETFSLNVHSQQKDTAIEHSSLKTIVGFLNSKGGKLFIGVNDSQDITGIDKEIDKFYKGKADSFLLHFKNNIDKHIGLQFSDYIDYDIQKLEGINVLVVECLESLKPCFLDEKDFYVRTNPSTDKLEGEKQWKYIQSHFKNLQTYNEILEFIEDNEIVCPMPTHWQDLHKLIARRVHGASTREVNIVSLLDEHGVESPLILNGWIASDFDKKERFLSHIQYAAENNIINHVKQFLLALSMDDFLHGDGLSRAEGTL